MQGTTYGPAATPPSVPVTTGRSLAELQAMRAEIDRAIVAETQRAYEQEVQRYTTIISTNEAQLVRIRADIQRLREQESLCMTQLNSAKSDLEKVRKKIGGGNNGVNNAPVNLNQCPVCGVQCKSAQKLTRHRALDGH